MIKKICGLALCALLFALCLPASVQQPKKVPRIGTPFHALTLTQRLLPSLSVIDTIFVIPTRYR